MTNDPGTLTWAPAGDDALGDPPARGPDERSYVFSTRGATHRIIVRKLGRHWAIREMYGLRVF